MDLLFAIRQSFGSFCASHHLRMIMNMDNMKFLIFMKVRDLRGQEIMILEYQILLERSNGLVETLSNINSKMRIPILCDAPHLSSGQIVIWSDFQQIFSSGAIKVFLKNTEMKNIYILQTRYNSELLGILYRYY